MQVSKPPTDKTRKTEFVNREVKREKQGGGDYETSVYRMQGSLKSLVCVFPLFLS
jgi:hypothetical protein